MAPVASTERMVPSTSMGVVEETYECYEEWVVEENRGMLLEEEEQQLNEDSEESPVVRNLFISIKFLNCFFEILGGDVGNLLIIICCRESHQAISVIVVL